jgi:hypothetical protein
MNKLKDPVEKKTGEIQGKKTEEEMKTFDISNLKSEDFQPLQQRAAASPHPFDGYPKKMVKVAETRSRGPKGARDVMMPAYAIIALNPKEVVFQDPSGNNVTIRNKKTGKEKIVNINSVHNRCVVDYEAGGVNTDICFDRTIKLAEGQEMTRCAFVPSHSARAQIMFKLDRSGDKIQVDRRYLLLDVKQAPRLRKVFEMIVNPKIRNERLARAISGESDEDLDAIAGD